MLPSPFSNMNFRKSSESSEIFTQLNHNMTFFHGLWMDNVCRSKFEGRWNRFKKYGQKSGQIWVCERFFEKISRNMTDTEKMMMTNIIGNFVADNIVFKVSKIGPVDPEIWAKKVVKITETRISWEIWKIESSIQRQSYRKYYGGQYFLWKWSDSSSSWGIILNNFFLVMYKLQQIIINMNFFLFEDFR